MLKNKIIGRKIRNIIILFMAIIVMIGAYKFIDRSKAEKVVEIDATVVDNYAYLENEETKLEAKQLDEDNFEIELPESINTKKIFQIVKVTLENISDSIEKESENEDIEITENRIYLTKEQVENVKVQMEVIYDIAILEKNEQEQYNKILLSEKSEEERKELETLEGTGKLYQKVLKFEDKENNKLVEVRGFLPVDAKLKVEELTKEQIKAIFGDKKIDVAYDIKIILEVVTQIPADEANPDAEPEEIIETIEVNPEEFGETCQVTIKDANIVENSQVYHVKEDNTYEQVNVKDNTEENISFEAPSFSVYAVGSDEIIPDAGEDTGDVRNAKYFY